MAGIGPALIVLWGWLFADSLRGVRDAEGHWQWVGIEVLFFANVPLLPWLVWRHGARWTAAMIAGAASVFWSGGAFALAGMSVVDDWF